MTAREIYEAILIELNKNFGTPDLLLEDFNHFINKGIFQWVQKRYNVLDSNSQVTDDVQVLKTTESLEAPDFYDTGTASKLKYVKKGNDYIFTCPLNDSFFHMAGVILEYRLMSNYKCYTSGSLFLMPAKRITSDQEGIINKNAWLRPSYRNPYYKIETSGVSNVTAGNPPVTTPVTPGSRIWINYGPDAHIKKNANDTISGIFKLEKVHCDYVKYPTPINLTYNQLDSLADTSQVMEFKPDVCHEIIKETVKLIALNTGNPILQSYDAVNMSVPPQGGISQEAQK